jgi:hypothetical protein
MELRIEWTLRTNAADQNPLENDHRYDICMNVTKLVRLSSHPATGLDRLGHSTSRVQARHSRIARDLQPLRVEAMGLESTTSTLRRSVARASDCVDTRMP